MVDLRPQRQPADSRLNRGLFLKIFHCHHWLAGERRVEQEEFTGYRLGWQ